MEDDSDTITVYTDGSCSRARADKRSFGGWAFHVSWGETLRSRYSFKEGTTNNEMELMAVLRALQFIAVTKHPINLFTDSEYVRCALTKWYKAWERQGWTTAVGGDVANREMIKEILEYLKRHRQKRVVEIHWVKGHNGNIENERVDLLAHSARVHQLSNWDERSDHRTHLGNAPVPVRQRTRQVAIRAH